MARTDTTPCVIAAPRVIYLSYSLQHGISKTYPIISPQVLTFHLTFITAPISTKTINMHIPTLLTVHTTTTTTTIPPRPTPNEPDPCLQRKFLSALICSDVNPAWTNDTLAADGWLCCWEQSVSAPGNLKIS
ncbi:hypothetical protein QBC39DRAFT_369051 [Podospora conica]|nr:hypothetical protein QBC39DRAFT_369051 [Schizothecium conicum]